MNIDESLRHQLSVIFQPLNTVAAAKAFPAPTTLRETLQKLIPSDGSRHRNLSPKQASYFATAAVDIWLRSVHSFLVSASLTEPSPIWAAVTGYYSSHYAVRGLAHLLGYFQLFRSKRIAQLVLEGGQCVCSFDKKNAGDAEHKLYWKVVKHNAAFAADGFFTLNDPGADDSDVRHRNHANYADHLAAYLGFRPLDEKALKDRIEYISKIAFDAPPLPRIREFPDIEYVQLIAYHRLVKFRRMLDEVLGGKNRFWTVHRNPSFAINFIDFQLVESTGYEQSGPTT